MATAEKTVYVCDQCGDEADEDDVVNEEKWIQVSVHGQEMQFCERCWDFI